VPNKVEQKNTGVPSRSACSKLYRYQENRQLTYIPVTIRWCLWYWLFRYSND